MGKRDRPYVYVREGHIDARDIKFKCIPACVSICPMCEGNGKYVQRYIEGSMTGSCDMCKTSGFVYDHTAKGVPISVTNQIAVANRLEFDHSTMYGIDWRKETIPA